MPKPVARKQERPALLSRPELRRRGWTDAMIRDLLVAPDEEKVNPRYRSAARMKLYLLTRVESIEASTEFARGRLSGQKRSETSKAVAAEKREQTLADVRRLVIDVPRIDIETLKIRAVEHQNGRRFEQSLDAAARVENLDPKVLDRWMVNYLRHEMTSYDKHLDALFGRVGTDEAGRVVREKVYAAIAAVYPILASECDRQLRGRSAPTRGR